MRQISTRSIRPRNSKACRSSNHAPGRQTTLLEAETDFDGGRIKAVLFRPDDQRLHQSLKSINQHAAGKTSRLSGHEKSIPENRQQFFSDLPDEQTRSLRRNVAPTLPRLPKTFVEGFQYFMLKTPLLTRIDLKFDPLFCPQTARPDKKSKRTRRKILQAAD